VQQLGEGAAAGEVSKRGTLDAIWADDHRLNNPANKARAALLRKVGAAVKEVAHVRGEIAYEAVALMNEGRAVLRLRCGVAVCRGAAAVADQLGGIIDRFERDRSTDARQLLEGDRSVRYSQHWTSRGPRADKLVERTFVPGNLRGEAQANQRVRLRAWRAPDEPEALLRDAALRGLGSGRDTAKQVVDESGEDGWLAHDDQRFGLVRVNAGAQVVFALECGRQKCASEADALALARLIQGRVPTASKDRSRLPELLTAGDLAGWKELLPATPPPERDEYDRMRLDGSIRDAAYSVDLRVWRRPAEGVAAKRAALAAEIPGATPAEGVAPGAVSGPTAVGQGTQFLFAVPATETVVQMNCSSGLCPGPEEAGALASRAYQKAQDAGNFVDPNAERPRPYVPRGHVKGRAERIWLPLPRFWLPVR
jgi:hypothetical protein